MKLCSVKWCENKHYAKLYCKKHYARFRNNWDPLIVQFVSKSLNINHYLYGTYRAMKERVNNINSKAYKNYWWRWINICDRRLWPYWFDNFIEDMWDRTEWMTLDRIDNNWNYCKENCRRASRYEQQSNIRCNKEVVWVYFFKNSNRYISTIGVKWKKIHLWTFKTIEEATLARKNAEIKYNIYKK